jgi:alpha/beta hydrolase family protein
MRVWTCLSAIIFFACFAFAGAGESSSERPNVFDLPHVQIKHALLQAKIAALFKTDDYAKAEKYCLEAVETIPHSPDGHYNLACTLARQGKTDEALASLEMAVKLGFNRVDHIKQDDDLSSLRDQERFQDAVKDATTAKPDQRQGWRYRVRPGNIENGVATVGESNTVWDTKLGVFRSFFKLDTAPPASEPIVEGFGDVGRLLRRWQAEGTAAGNHGDLYDNHDSDHSNMKYAMFPQLTRIEFSEAPKSRKFHQGLQVQFLYNGVTLGNSSTAITSGLLWRSQARLALGNPRTAALLFLQYRGNHLYVYPEHRDHDPGHNRHGGSGHGDVFAFNTPYLIISQGSSGSDRVFLDALAATLAAFRPEVKTELARNGALIPTIQMIFRLCNKSVAKSDRYLAGVAHPTVFEGSHLDTRAMVSTAHDITKETMPPLVQLKVVEEDEPVSGRDCFDAGRGEKLIDTPCAIARVVRSVHYYRRMVVSAEPSKDLGDRPLQYHWSVLRGDAKRIKIKKLNDRGSVVELLIPYHRRAPIAPGNPIESNRVDIGAFVHNGAHYSAPAFVTFYYLDNEKREYDKEHRIQVVDYADPEVSKNYVDPVIDIRKDWRDEYHHDESGNLTGWTRIRDGSKQQFTAEGLLIVSHNAEGRATKARRVRYQVEPRPSRTPILRQQPTDEFVQLN